MILLCTSLKAAPGAILLAQASWPLDRAKPRPLGYEMNGIRLTPLTGFCGVPRGQGRPSMVSYPVHSVRPLSMAFLLWFLLRGVRIVVGNGARLFRAMLHGEDCATAVCTGWRRSVPSWLRRLPGRDSPGWLTGREGGDGCVGAVRGTVEWMCRGLVMDLQGGLRSGG